MKLSEQRLLVDRLQSIATLAVEAQEHVGSTQSADQLREAIESISVDIMHAQRIVDADETANDPAQHAFKPSRGFGDCCAICGENESSHEG